jgi:hypothetical protein
MVISFKDSPCMIASKKFPYGAHCPIDCCCAATGHIWLYGVHQIHYYIILWLKGISMHGARSETENSEIGWTGAAQYICDIQQN